MDYAFPKPITVIPRFLPYHEKPIFNRLEVGKTTLLCQKLQQIRIATKLAKASQYLLL